MEATLSTLWSTDIDPEIRVQTAMRGAVAIVVAVAPPQKQQLAASIAMSEARLHNRRSAPYS